MGDYVTQLLTLAAVGQEYRHTLCECEKKDSSQQNLVFFKSISKLLLPELYEFATVLSHTLFLVGVSCRCQIQYIHAICKMLIAWHLIKKKIKRKTSPEHDFVYNVTK